MTDITADQQESLESAYADLSADEGRTVTIASLRSAAGVSQNVAAAWLRARRAEEEAAERAAQRETTPDVPTKALADAAAHAQALWVDAVAAARAEVADLHTAQLDDAVRAAEEAAARADEATMRADSAEEKLADATASLEDLRATRESWTQATEAAQAEARAAQAEAQAAAATLAETQSALVSAQETQAATTAVVADLRSERASWTQAAEAARTDAQTAVAALAEAQGELTALRAVLTQQQASPDVNAANGIVDHADQNPVH